MVLAIGVAYMLLTRNWLNAASPAEVGAPKARRTLRDLIRDYRLAGRERRLQVQLGSPLIGSTLEELQLRTAWAPTWSAWSGCASSTARWSRSAAAPS